MAIFATYVIMVMVMLVVQVIEVVNYQLSLVAAQLKTVIKSPEHPPPPQDYPFLNLLPFVSSLSRVSHQARHLQILVAELDPREPSPHSSPAPRCCFPAITVFALCFIIIVFRRYRHHIEVKARRMIRHYAMKQLKRILPRIPRRVETIFRECIREMKKSIVLGLTKAAANELLNLVTSEIRQAAK